MTLFLILGAMLALLFGIVPYTLGRLAGAIARKVARLMKPP